MSCGIGTTAKPIKLGVSPMGQVRPSNLAYITIITINIFQVCCSKFVLIFSTFSHLCFFFIHHGLLSVFLFYRTKGGLDYELVMTRYESCAQNLSGFV